MKKLILLATVILAAFGCSSTDNWDDPVIPISLQGIEAVNIDNSGALPVLGDSVVRKEAYMLGIKWITSNVPDDEEDKFITDPIEQGQQTYGSIAKNYSKAIKCNTAFNASIPAGRYVSKFFKEMDSKYLPNGIDEGFVLLAAPSPGMHSFRVEYYLDNELKFYYDTPFINFY